MLNTDIFDNEGVDGEYNRKDWARLSTQHKYFYTTIQKAMFDKIVKANLQAYGKEYGYEEVEKSLRKSSGWRSPFVTQRHGGQINSRHHHASAIDILKFGIFAVNKPASCCGLVLIDSGKCWHYQLKEG